MNMVKQSAKCHYMIVNCYLAFEILMFILHSEKLNDFNDSYSKDDKDIFFRCLNKWSIENLNK